MARSELQANSLVRVGDRVLLVYRPTSTIKFAIENLNAGPVKLPPFPGIPGGIVIPSKLQREIQLREAVMGRIRDAGKIEPETGVYVDRDSRLLIVGRVVSNPLWLAIVAGIGSIALGVGAINWLVDQYVELETAFQLDTGDAGELERIAELSPAESRQLTGGDRGFLETLLDPLNETLRLGAFLAFGIGLFLIAREL